MPEFVRSRDQYVVGNPDIIEEYRQALAVRKPSDNSAIEIKSPVDGAKMEVIRGQIIGADVNGDGYEDVIEGRGYRIGYGTPERPFRWVTFASVFLGSPERIFAENECHDLPDAPDMLCAGRQIQEPAAIDWERSAMMMIDGSEDALSCDAAVAEGVHDIQNFAILSEQAFGLLKTAILSKEGDALAYETTLTVLMEEGFHYSLGALKRRIAEETDERAAQRLHNVLKQVEGKEEGIDECGDVPGCLQLRELWGSPPDAAMCDERYADILEIVKFETDPISEARFLRKKAEFIQIQKKQGGLFDGSESGFVAKANRYARRHNYETYADYRLDRLFGISADEYESFAKEYLKKNQPELKRLVANLKKVAGGRPVWELNIWELLEKKRETALKKLRINEEPTLSVNDALVIAKRFFADLGLRISETAGEGDVTFDLFSRKEKTQGAYQQELGDGSENVVITNYAPGGRIKLDEFAAELVHELGHALHYHHAAATAGGSFFGGARMATPAVRETFSGMAEEMIFTKEWMERYLSPYEGFKNPAVRQALAHEYKDMRMYWASVIVALPLWEINLYREENPDGSARSMDERLRYWGDLGKTYFNYDDVGMDTSRVAFYSVQFEHPGKYPIQRPAYVLGMNLRDEIAGDFQNAMRSGDEGEFEDVRERLVGLFQRSAWLKTVKKAEEFYHGGRGMGID